MYPSTMAFFCYNLKVKDFRRDRDANSALMIAFL